MARRRLAVLIVWFATWPAGAFAQGDFIDYLNQFSGPGPFYGHIQSLNLRLLCMKDVGNDSHDFDSCISDTDEKIRTVIDMNFGLAASGDNRRFSDAPPQDPLNTLPVRSFRVGATYSYRVSPMLDVGAGGGIMVLTGDGFENQTHPFFTPFTVSFVPLGFMRNGAWLKWGRVLRIRYSGRYVLGELNAAKDFHAQSNYLKEGEFNQGFNIGFDFWSFLPDLLRR